MSKIVPTTLIAFGVVFIGQAAAQGYLGARDALSPPPVEAPFDLPPVSSFPLSSFGTSSSTTVHATVGNTVEGSDFSLGLQPAIEWQRRVPAHFPPVTISGSGTPQQARFNGYVLDSWRSSRQLTWS